MRKARNWNMKLLSELRVFRKAEEACRGSQSLDRLVCLLAMLFMYR